MSDYKSIIAFSYSPGTNKKSLLSERALAALHDGMNAGFSDGDFSFQRKNINDSMMPELCEWLIKFEIKFRKLDLEHNQITSVGVSMLFDTLKVNNSSLKEIYLSANKHIDHKCMKSLGEYIKSNKYIETIRLDNTSISDTGIKVLAPYLDGNTTFKELTLNGNSRITDKSIPLLIKMIESSRIEGIDVYGTSITQKSTIHPSLTYNSIKNRSNKLSFPLVDLNDDDLIKICNIMKKYGIDKLKVINLEANKISSRGAIYLINTLKECNSAVSWLNLSYNEIDDECMKQVGEFIQCNAHLERLDFDNSNFPTNITDKGIEILSEHLIGNTTLKQLSFVNNERITNASVSYLLEIAKKSCVSKIGLTRTKLFVFQEVEVHQALSIPIDEREIPIKSNTKSAAKVSASVSASASM